MVSADVTSREAVVFFGLLAACGRRLPRMQFRVTSGPACLTGLLWSIGNFLSIYAVQVRCGSSLATDNPYVNLVDSHLHWCWLSMPSRANAEPPLMVTAALRPSRSALHVHPSHAWPGLKKHWLLHSQALIEGLCWGPIS